MCSLNLTISGVGQTNPEYELRSEFTTTEILDFITDQKSFGNRNELYLRFLLANEFMEKLVQVGLF